MARFANARQIAHFEYIIFAPNYESRSWQSHGVQCTRDRHRFTGQCYGCTIDVTELCYESGRGGWKLLLVTEWWEVSGRVIRSVKWLKVLTGSAFNVSQWLSRNRAAKPQMGSGRSTENTR